MHKCSLTIACVESRPHFRAMDGPKRLITIIAVFSIGFLLMWNWRGWTWYPLATAVIFGLWSAFIIDLHWSSVAKPKERARGYAQVLLIVTILGYALYSFSIIRISDCGITLSGLECISMAF